MNKKSLEKLEFNKIKEIISKGCISSAGKSIVEKFEPYDNIHEIKKALNETEEAVKLINMKGSAPFEGVYDVMDALMMARKGSTLPAVSILRIGNILSSTHKIAKYLKNENLDVPHLMDLTSAFTLIDDLEREIARTILGENEIADNASKALSSIRKSLKDKNASIKDKIQSLVRENSKYLQDNLYTIRGDRYVIPVRNEYKSHVPGLVHDQSNSGQTLFIEPIGLVNLNNEIRELMLKEKAEIDRILRELSLRITTHADSIITNAKIIYKLDSIFAKAKYALRYDCVNVDVKEDGSFNLISARHPLIDERKVVASTIYLGENYTSLIITGPNTGGKTVTLKTTGLLHAMALSGILIPVNEHSHVSFFNEIFADIGDEQSIEQSLSTFSSHMRNIVNIIEKADHTSLVLFDELGAGTDPTEGAALAIAILDELKSRGSRIVATTHYSELKAYALRTPRVENASVEFDVDTLRPTYRLLIGVPGKSNAFLISKRLGLPEYIIDNSKKLIEEDSLKFEDLIENLQKTSIKANDDAMKSATIRRELESKEKELDERLKRLDEIKERQLEEAKREARLHLKDIKDEADAILKDLRELDLDLKSPDSRQRLEKSRQKLRDTMNKLDGIGNSKKEGRESNSNDINPKDIKSGMEMKYDRLNQIVTVITTPDSKGDLQVQAGIMKITVNLKDLSYTKETKQAKKLKKREVNLNLRSVPMSIDLRGLDAQEALYRTDQYLDEAALGGLNQVTIIHGVGTGVLKKEITKMLSNHPHVKKSRPGEYGEGGMGVTIVEVK